MFMCHEGRGGTVWEAERIDEREAGVQGQTYSPYNRYFMKKLNNS